MSEAEQVTVAPTAVTGEPLPTPTPAPQSSPSPSPSPLPGPDLEIAAGPVSESTDVADSDSDPDHPHVQALAAGADLEQAPHIHTAASWVEDHWVPFERACQWAFQNANDLFASIAEVEKLVAATIQQFKSGFKDVTKGPA